MSIQGKRSYSGLGDDPVASRHSRLKLPVANSIPVWILHFGFRLQKARNGENNLCTQTPQGTH